ncbi:hypothetical protein [Dermatobacter hominis]|uniref:hypothetical protein n=1 Tax=Dermatobacter hominis TaxID=2884263 RepID=UPI001D1045EC|nr:hypothetical protein [Dermatobacter hominis]UDY36091.1 hypothetical protein LH044_00815 [Dermatobacter hominis]
MAVVLTGLGACATHVDEGASSSGPTTTAFSMATTLTLPPTVTTTTTIPITCGPLTAADVATVLEVDLAEVEPIVDPDRPDDPPCAFRSGEWSMSARVTGIPPLPPGSHVDGERMPPVPGVALPSGLVVGLQRGGRYGGQAQIFVGDRIVIVSVSNDAEGPDTWANVPGPLQAPRTEQVTTAIAQRVASHL